MKKVLVALPEGIINLLDNELLGKMGEGRSDTLRAIIINWLGEKGYLTKKGDIC
jgi:metal-responsive CopG/Arc/MetJ family transcriptional regulator